MQASGFELQPLPTACPQRLTAALELIGARWSLLIVNALSTGPARFSELRRKLPGLSANVLTQRLHELEKSELLRRIVLPQPASCRVFELTPRGIALAPVLRAINLWQLTSPGPSAVSARKSKSLASERPDR